MPMNFRSWTVYNFLRGLWLALWNPWVFKPHKDRGRLLRMLFSGAVIQGGATKIAMQAVAWGRFSTAGATLAKIGNVAFARGGAGVYTATLGDGGIDATQCHASITAETANIIAQLVHTSDTVKGINTFLGSTGAATDSQVDVALWEVLLF